MSGNDDSSDLSFYPYFNPSVAAAVVACVLFGIGFVLSSYQTIRDKAWIWFVMLVAIGMEMVGYAFRIASAKNVTDRTAFVVQFCLVVLAPVLMAGIVYVVFGRIVFHVVPPAARTTKLLWVPPRFITPIFVGFDIFALFLQLVGAVQLSATQVTDPNYLSKINNGKNLAMSGVIIQLAAFGLFTIIAARFHFTSRQFADELRGRFQTTPGDKFVRLEGGGRKFNPNWRTLLYAVNSACAMILVRSIYREIDFSGGKGNTLDEYEFYPYVLDALPMLIVVILFTICPPGSYVQMSWRRTKGDRPSTAADTDTEGFVLHSREGFASA